MTYDLSNSLEANNARTRLALLINRKAVIVLTERKQRSLSQNNYLHLLLGYFASQTGNTLDYVKRIYYKIACNPDIFIFENHDPIVGQVKCLRSSRDLSKEEMSLSIERFRNWSSDTAGIHLPDASSEDEIREMQREVEKYKTYLY